MEFYLCHPLKAQPSESEEPKPEVTAKMIVTASYCKLPERKAYIGMQTLAA